MISGIGSCLGAMGQFPCCPLPNPYKNVNQGSVGEYISGPQRGNRKLTVLGLVSRFGQFYKVCTCKLTLEGLVLTIFSGR